MNEKKIQVDYFVSVRYLYHLRAVYGYVNGED